MTYLNRFFSIAGCLAVAVFLAGGTSLSASEGKATVKIGYLYTDDEGSLAVNQERYNLYEGVGLSLDNLRYSFDNGVSLSADLRNTTRNDRDMAASVMKPGRFRVSLFNRQYRRVYDSSGNAFTRRQTSGGSVSLRPLKELELFGGFSATDRHGTRNDNIPETIDSMLVDYTNVSYNFGAALTSSRRHLRIQYSTLDFTNDVAGATNNTGRQADEIRITGSTPVPGYEWVLLSGGYRYRKDQIDTDPTELTTKHGWAASKVFLPYGIIADYRFSFARTDQTTLAQETDNVSNTISVGRDWAGHYGLRVGYENRIADDLTDRTESDAFLFSGWFNYQRKLFVRGLVTTRDKDVVTGATLMGNQSVTNHRFTVKYLVPKYGDVSVQWTGRVSEHQPDLGIRDTLTNSELESRVDYNVLSATVNVHLAGYGTVTLNHSYYVGKYDNNSDGTSYQFSDHLFRSSLETKRYRKLQLNFAATYYRSRRDNNIEKFSLSFGGDYLFLDDHHVGLKYDVYNFDDYIEAGRFYTGNMVQLYVTKELVL